MNKGLKFVIGIAAGTLAGCVSESLDKNWDNKDLLEWSAGGVIGSTLVTWRF
ncbi:hypothetical protein JZU68_01420 [bacterium]|nr:hypothetical protein [bacterium]